MRECGVVGDEVVAGDVVAGVEAEEVFAQARQFGVAVCRQGFDRFVARACGGFGAQAVGDIGLGSAPSLWGIVGAPKARSHWFGYSHALAGQDGNWSADEIDAYLADPVGYLPGTTKTLTRVRDPDERKRIIAALQSLSGR